MTVREAISACLPILRDMSLKGVAFHKPANLSFGWGGEEMTGLNLSLPDIWYRLEHGYPLRSAIVQTQKQYPGLDFGKAARILLIEHEGGSLIQALLALQVNTYHLDGWTNILDQDGWEFLRQDGIEIPIPDRDIIRQGGRILQLPELITRCEVLVFSRPKSISVVERD